MERIRGINKTMGSDTGEQESENMIQEGRSVSEGKDDKENRRTEETDSEESDQVKVVKGEFKFTFRRRVESVKEDAIKINQIRGDNKRKREEVAVLERELERDNILGKLTK